MINAVPVFHRIHVGLPGQIPGMPPIPRVIPRPPQRMSQYIPIIEKIPKNEIFNNIKSIDMPLYELPEDMLFLIAKNLHPVFVSNMLVTSKKLYNMCGNMFWDNLFKHFYPNMLEHIEKYKDLVFHSNKISTNYCNKIRFIKWSNIISNNTFNNIINVPDNKEIINYMYLRILTKIIKKCNESNFYEPIILLLMKISNKYNIFNSAIKLNKNKHTIFNSAIKLNKNKHTIPFVTHIFKTIDYSNITNIIILANNGFLTIYLDNFNNNTIIDNIGFKYIFNNITYENKLIFIKHPNISNKIKIYIFEDIISTNCGKILNDMYDLPHLSLDIEILLINYIEDGKYIHQNNIELLYNKTNNISLKAKLFGVNITPFTKNITTIIDSIKNEQFNLSLYPLKNNIVLLNRLICNDKCALVLRSNTRVLDSKNQGSSHFIKYILKNKLSMINRYEFIEYLLENKRLSKKYYKVLIELLKYTNSIDFLYKIFLNENFIYNVENILEFRDYTISIIKNKLSDNDCVKLFKYSCNNNINIYAHISAININENKLNINEYKYLRIALKNNNKYIIQLLLQNFSSTLDEHIVKIIKKTL